RGIDLPEGHADDPPGAATVHGLGNRKNVELLRRIRTDGVEAYDGTLRYLRAVRARGLRTAIVSSSANCRDVLRSIDAEDLFDVRVDAGTAAARGLPGKPAPDTFLAAARDLGVRPSRRPCSRTRWRAWRRAARAGSASSSAWTAPAAATSSTPTAPTASSPTSPNSSTPHRRAPAGPAPCAPGNGPVALGSRARWPAVSCPACRRPEDSLTVICGSLPTGACARADTGSATDDHAGTGIDDGRRHRCPAPRQAAERQNVRDRPGPPGRRHRPARRRGGRLHRRPAAARAPRARPRLGRGRLRQPGHLPPPRRLLQRPARTRSE